ncbi:MAG: hypothetical protein JSU82_17345 [Rhodospirillales bacterium]|nr:MAG: hypothetical protein JSU82_17345 [Rhodospirillales bacterium]
MNQVSQMQTTGRPDPDPETLEATRAKVRQLLDQSESFKQLPPDERREIARQMVRIGSYMANPDGLIRQASDREQGGPLAAQQARVTSGGVRDAASRASSDPGFAGQDFEGGAIRQGTEQFGELIGKVDFPAFVGGLIENVFQAIVTSTIEQMRAYAEMLKSISQSVDDFARDNITENNARDWLSDSYPDLFDISTSQEDEFGFADEGGGRQPRLVTTGEDAETGLTTVSQDLGLEKPITDISDAETEAALVRAARMAMAKSRMQLLASMVLLGINRIVVSDGSIRAKVVFGMRASDIARRRSRASLYDRQASSRRSFAAGTFGFFGIAGAAGTASSQSHVTTVGSSLDESSTSQAQLKAQLSGEVRVNFKSDYLPAERLATPEMIAAIQGNAMPQQPPHLQQATGAAGAAPVAAAPGAARAAPAAPDASAPAGG